MLVIRASSPLVRLDRSGEKQLKIDSPCDNAATNCGSDAKCVSSIAMHQECRNMYLFAPHVNISQQDGACVIFPLAIYDVNIDYQYCSDHRNSL